MASWASSPAVRRSMTSNRSRDTAPELRVRRALHSRGLRYRVAYRPIPSLRRTADVVFTRQKVAVFVDGCFWHGCPTHCRIPTTNRSYWSAKIGGNSDRDRATNETLEAAGWSVIRAWEHEDASDVADRVERAVRRRRAD